MILQKTLKEMSLVRLAIGHRGIKLAVVRIGADQDVLQATSHHRRPWAWCVGLAPCESSQDDCKSESKGPGPGDTPAATKMQT